MSADGEQGGVIQADRDAAGKLFGKTDWSYSQFVTGKRDKDEKVLAFAAHRLAHATPVADTPVPSDVVLMIIRNVLYRSKMNGCSADVYDTAEEIAAALAKHTTSPEDAA